MPHTPFSHYQSGADADRPAGGGGDGYADLFAFRDGEWPLPPGTEPWPPGRSLRGGAFNPHRRGERGTPPSPRRDPAPP
ncbi:MAG TPA: hypothetical protein VFS43_05800 [Polyangiaceae bacterium]|nr:hypothetical protein [Polyangiaceae bacterium]